MDIQIVQDLQFQILNSVKTRIEQNKLRAVKYLDLGVTVIRVLCYTNEIVPIMEKQFTYVLRDEMDQYDSTIVVWKEDEIGDFANEVYKHLTKQQRMQIKAEMLWCRRIYPFIRCVDDNGTPLVKVDCWENVVEVFDKDRKIIYYGVANFEPEIFDKHGHCFKQVINKLVKSVTVNLTHGAVFGCDGQGFLLCGRGKRGKSTLTVQSMLQGFEYVSDDFQILAQTQDGLLAYPIYSIITLSHRMYNEMYDYFKGKFVCDNFSQDKYLFNISAYHEQFRSGYPIKFCLFPEIVADDNPSIVECTPEDKGRAIVHLLHSTLIQMQELGDTTTIRKLFDMVKDLSFYKFNLCDDIVANTNYLRKFLTENYVVSKDNRALPKILSDITFGLATFLDTGECRFYAMNKFATNVYQLLCSGVSAGAIELQLKQFEQFNSEIMNEFTVLQKLIGDKGLISEIFSVTDAESVNVELAQKSDYHLSVLEYVGDKSQELVRVKEK